MPRREREAREADAVVRALADPATYGHGPVSVEHVQTHISHVFLVGPWVYKLKKPVTFPFLDFGSVEKRRHFCEREVVLNRRLSPNVYLGVVPISTRNGRFVFGAGDEVVEYAVQMRKLSERTSMRPSIPCSMRFARISPPCMSLR